jgi:GT2 family glycosyltransferase
VTSFDSLLSPFYWEDVELSFRAWKRGYTVLYEPRSVVRHRVSSTISKLNQRRVRMIEQRNRLIYHWIHLQDFKMLTSHILWVVLLALTAPLRFKPLFFLSCVEALKRLPAIRKRRAEEREHAKRTDRELFAIFKELKMRNEVKVYDGIKESEE